MRRDVIAFLAAVVLPLTVAYIALCVATRKRCATCYYYSPGQRNGGCWKHGSHGEAIGTSADGSCSDWKIARGCRTCGVDNCYGRMMGYGGGEGSQCSMWIKKKG